MCVVVIVIQHVIIHKTIASECTSEHPKSQNFLKGHAPRPPRERGLMSSQLLPQYTCLILRVRKHL